MLILSGGGAGAQTKELYEFYSSAINHQQPILYIPVAIPMDDYSGCLRWIKKELGVYGLTNIDMVSDIESLNALDFCNYSSLFIGGGNTYRLLEIFKSTNLFDKVKKYVEDGGVVLGGSAGAILFGRDIDASSFEDNNENGFMDTNGYDMLFGYSILCHFDSDNSKMSSFINSYIARKDGLVALPEETSLIIDGDDVLVVGQKPCTIYYDSRELQISPDNPLVLR